MSIVCQKQVHLRAMSSNRTKALDISPAVRNAVYERDSHDGAPCCVICGYVRCLQLSHYISRAQSGLGIPENLVTLCVNCHSIFDFGRLEARQGMKRQIEEYLKHRYGESWSETELRYKRE